MSGPEGLARLQAAFAAAVGGGQGEAVASHLAGEPALAMRRLAIYRNAIAANRRGSLLAAFPVVARLVGDGFFAEAVRQFVASAPPAEADLNRYGAGFPAFLAAYPHADAMPWLADIARLEWARQESLMAGDSPGIDFAALAAVEDAAHPTLRFRFHPSARLVRSRWPVLALWEANQPGRDGTPDRDGGEDDVLVWRAGGRVRAALLSAPEADFVACLLRGLSLEEAADARPGWNFAPVLERVAIEGLLAGFAAGRVPPG